MISLINEDGSKIGIKFTKFSDGCGSVVVGFISDYSKVWMSCDVEDCNQDIIKILLVNDAIKRQSSTISVSLHLPYVPQARADRVFQEGGCLPIKVFADLINSCQFDSVMIKDPHSDVTSALINNVSIIKQEQCLKNAMHNISRYMKDFTICAPDLGATKKIFDSVQLLGHDDYIQAIKIRDVETGNIIKCDVVQQEVFGDVLIVDDISDKGGSFIHLAQLLKQRGADRVGLFVTHAIFPDGLDKLEKDVDFIWADGIVGTSINQETLLKFNERN